MKKLQSGVELTEAEENKLEEYGKEMEKKYANGAKITQNAGKTSVAIVKKTAAPQNRIPTTIPVLNTESYIKLASLLMQSYGPKSGILPRLNALLAQTNKTTNGADYGALFMMKGAGSASIYTCAWSAVKNPTDVLTANNLAVSLKNQGEYLKAMQVLKYADKIRPGVGLILSNMGWIYYDTGDYGSAKKVFEDALKIAPGMTSPCLGLGIIAQSEGNSLKAKEYLRKALKSRYSIAGVRAYKKVQETTTDNQTNNRPLSDEKENTGNYHTPEIPVYEHPQKMAPQKQVIQSYVEKINLRLDRVTEKMQSLSELIRKQQERAVQDPDNSIIYNRDFAKEIMMLEDVDMLLFGENSNYGSSVKKSSEFTENAQRLLDQNSNLSSSYLEAITRLDEKLAPLYEKMVACKGDEGCTKAVQKEIEPLETEKKQINYKLCKSGKQQMDILLSGGCKSLSLLQAQLKETIPDYYAFTDPILKKIYTPALNEFYNLRREAKVLSVQQALASRALGLANDAEKYYELKCIEPEPPAQPEPEIEDAAAPKRKPEECPLGDGINAGFGTFAFELTCTHVKVSGGEGVLVSVKKDFVKHETTLWAGVGAKVEYGHGNLTGEASIGVGVSLGRNSTDIEFTSSVKAGLGGLMETEISGRIAMDSGAEIDMETSFLP